MPCRIVSRRMWSTRLMLEATLHEPSCVSFVTLTFKEEPEDVSRSSLRDTAQDFLKRLRYYNEGPVRYYLVGEFGVRGGRAHFHAALFGAYVGLHRGDSRSRCMCPVCRAWRLGFVHIGALEPASARYVLKYMEDARNAPQYLALMSRKPGLGAGAVSSIADGCVTAGGARYMATFGDVPNAVRSGARWPLGRYLLGKVRSELGVEELGEVAATARALDLQESLRAPGARVAREEVRRQDSLNAASSVQIAKSKEKL